MIFSNEIFIYVFSAEENKDVFKVENKQHLWTPITFK